MNQLRDYQQTVEKSKIGICCRSSFIAEFDAQENVAMPTLIAGETKEIAHKKAKHVINLSCLDDCNIYLRNYQVVSVNVSPLHEH